MTEVNGSRIDFINHEPVEGDLLADRLENGAFSPQEALRHAIAIGSLLHKAHRRGVIHGSLSPYSIVVGASEASILQPANPPDARGTGYLSPEQVSGQAPDERSDIFSFGAVIYHMLSGRPPFPGHGPELPDAIMHRPPAALLAKTPVAAALEGVIAGCLVKDPAHRRQRVQNAVTELKLTGRSLPDVADRRARLAARGRPNWPMPAPPAEAKPRAAPPISSQAPRFALPPAYWVETAPEPRPDGARRRFVALAAAALVLAAASVGLAVYLRQIPRPVVKFTVMPENATYPGIASVSPDGHFLVFSAMGPEGQRMLWLRALDESHSRVIPGTEGGSAPFWSPDSHAVGFFASRSLKTWRVQVSGYGMPIGNPRTICPVDFNTGGGSWNQDGTILFASSLFDGLYRVPAAGGQPQPVLKLDSSKGQRSFRWPQFLPDGKHFLFFVLTDLNEMTGVYTGALESGSTRRLFRSETNAVFSPMANSQLSRSSGYLLFIRERTLMGQAFSAGGLELEGDPVALATDIGAVESLMLAPVSVSNTATLVYQTTGQPTRQLVWMDRSGKQVGTVGEPAEWGPPRIAPDGKRIAAGKFSAGGKFPYNLWVIDEKGSATQVTSEFEAGSPVWSPDGSRLAFWGNQNKADAIYIKTAVPGGKSEVLYKSAGRKYPTDWSRDGKYIFFGEIAPGTAGLWGISLPDRHAGAILNTLHSEGYTALSPDGRWLAFQSGESDGNQVYVEAFGGIVAATGRIWRASPNGGALPRWRGDSKEMFFVDRTGNLWASAVHPVGAEFAFDPPKVLFQVPVLPKTPWNFFDVTPDGRRFLLNAPFEWPDSSRITVITNWTEKLKR